MLINLRQAQALVEVLENEADVDEFVTLRQGHESQIMGMSDDVHVATDQGGILISPNGNMVERG